MSSEIKFTTDREKNNFFFIDHRVYFNETNAVGGVVYFSNFVKWQGLAREEYFIQTVPDWQEIMKSIASAQLNMVTVEEHSYFIHHAFFGDDILIQLQTTNIKKFSFDMIFFISNSKTKMLLYEGIQKLAFDNFKGKFVDIPATMLQSIKKYELDRENTQFQKLKLSST